MESDHNPLILESDSEIIQPKLFIFEAMWLEQAGFREMLINRIPDRGHLDIQEFWRILKIEMRKACKGWGANLKGEMRRRKKELSHKIQQLENKADQEGLNEEEWGQRYKLE